MIQFRSSTRLSAGHIWGGGHTLATDPSLNGWSCRKVGNYKYILSRKGDTVCATLREVRGGWDVGLFWNTPLTVREWILGQRKQCPEGYTIDGEYLQVGDYPGFGLAIIGFLAEQREYQQG